MLLSPYHAVVRRLVRRGLAQVGSGRTEDVARQFSPGATLRFSGTHALGGELRGREQIAAFFARLRRLFPNLRLTPLDIVVAGPPWATVVATRFRVDAVLPGGEAYQNEGVQYLRIRWGAIAEDLLYEDTAKLREAFAVIAAAGNAEALAASVLSET